MERLFFWLSVRDGNQQYWRRCHLAYDDWVMSTIYFYVSGYLLLLKLEEKYQCGKEHGKLGEWILLWGIILLLFFIGFLTEAYLNPGMVHFVLKKYKKFYEIFTTYCG